MKFSFIMMLNILFSYSEKNPSIFFSLNRTPIFENRRIERYNKRKQKKKKQKGGLLCYC